MNTASEPEKIVQDKSFYPHLISLMKPSLNTLRKIPHHILPLLNQSQDERCPRIDHTLSPYRSTYPLPISSADEVSELNDDPVMRLVQKKEKHQADLAIIQNKYAQQMKNRNVRRVRKNYPENVRLRIVGECAEVMENDPDPYFSGEYDWYFTGGSLTLIDDSLFHVHSRAGELDQLKMSQISLEKGKFRIEPEMQFAELSEQIAPSGTIYEVRKASSNRKLLTVRQKHRISVVDPFTKYVCNKIDSDTTPFVSAVFDNRNLITTDAKHTVKVWDLESNSTIHSEELDIDVMAPHTEPWSCVRNFNCDTFAHFDRDHLRLFDIRQPLNTESAAFELRFRKYFEDCEKITCAELAPNRPALMIGSTHKLFGIDIRMANTDLRDEIFTINKWNHNLQSRPTMINILDNMDEAAERIFVSGQLSGDIRLCQTKKYAIDAFGAPFKPLKPYTLRESYQIARKEGYLLHCSSKALDQLRMSTTGIVSWLSDSLTPHLIIQNSMGELFAQEFVDRADWDDHFDRRTIAHSMDEWDKHLIGLNKNAKPFYGTDLVDFRPMVDMLANNVKNGVGLCDAFDSDVDCQPRKPKWRQGTKMLNSYVDALAQSMLSIWELPGETETSTANIIGSKAAPLKVRVSNWLEQSAAPVELDDNTESGAMVQIDAIETMPAVSPVTQDAVAKEPKKKKARQSRVFVPGF